MIELASCARVYSRLDKSRLRDEGSTVAEMAGASLDLPAGRWSSVLVADSDAEQVACHYVTDVLRLRSLPGHVVDRAGSLVAQAVERLGRSTRGLFNIAVEVTTTTVTVTVTGPGRELLDSFTVDAAGGVTGLAQGEREDSQLRFQTLVRIAEALAAADTLTAVSDGVTGVVRRHLDAAFTGIAVLDPLAVGYLRYVSMDPLPSETARDWAEILIEDTSPVGAAAQGRPTNFSSQGDAEQSFPGIGEHMRIAGVRSISHVPLSVGGDPIGVLAVSWVDEHVLDVEEQALLATVAAHTAVAVARCRGSVVAPEPTSVASLADVGASGAAAAAVRPLRVLLVDDTADIRELLAALFARRSDVHVVAEAKDGQEAVELAAALQPDIVVLDVAMPVLDGIAALPRLVAAAPHARIVMLSALPAGLRAPAALATGAMAYVEKTTAVATLVDDLLEGAKLLDVAVRRLTEQVDHQLDADTRQIQLARHFVADTLERWEQSPLADTVVLLLSELVTNAVVHARSAPRVSVRLLPDRVHVEVTDQDPRVARALPPTLDQTSGRGLAIIESLSMGWGTAVLPHGKVVWFDVARDST